MAKVDLNSPRAYVAPYNAIMDKQGNIIATMEPGTDAAVGPLLAKLPTVWLGLVGVYPVHKVGKKKAGRLLDGRTWEEIPMNRMESDIRPKPVSFYRWLITNYANSNTAAGDLARDARFDSHFPKKSNRKKTISNYLEPRACDAAMETFGRVWPRYELEVLGPAKCAPSLVGV